MKHRNELGLLSSLLILSFYSASCRHEISSSTSGTVGAERHSIDAAIIHEELIHTSAECRNPLVNLFVSAFTDGLLRNGAISDGGIDNPVGKKMRSDSLYFQVVRIGSIFDYELADGIVDPKITPCLPHHLGVHLGTFARDYVDELSTAFGSDVKKIKEAAKYIKSDIDEFQVASFSGRESIKAWPEGSSLPAAFQTALRKGVREKILTAKISREQDDDPEEKLRGFASSYAPLYVSLNTDYDRQATQTYVEAYLPPLYEIQNANVDELATWHLTQGMKRHALPRPADISVAKLTDVGYLQNPESSDTPVIKVQLFKDLKDPNRIHTRTIFGKWDDKGPDKGVIGLDYRDYRDAFYVGFYPNMAIKDSDNALVKKAKKSLNEATRRFKIDARIHRLALDLVRVPPTPETKASGLSYRPKFSMKDSDISFRLHQPLGDESESKGLKALGFNCDGLYEGQRDCYRDFGVYTELRDFFLKGDNSAPQDTTLLTKVGHKFRDAVNGIIAANVKFVIEWNMSEIETAIDNQFEQIFTDLVDQQNDLHKKINDRLESRLFGTKS
ncbi:MAG: hypothetical protein H7249_09735 [Chitinophagaceae bacterium]|nr:hypothetical protein [Oligoflexus sp.]